jgi:phosphotransferase system HPr (HPr) family protein
MIETRLTILHPAGLHARPAALFVQTAGRYQSTVRVANLTRNTRPVDAKSILGILSLGVSSGHEIQITAEGSDEGAAMSHLQQLVESNFRE